MNRLQALNADREFCVTLNHTAAIDPAKIIKTIQYSHPVFTEAGHVAQSAAQARSADRTARTSRVRTGAGASTRTAWRARFGSPSGSELTGCDPQRDLLRHAASSAHAPKKTHAFTSPDRIAVRRPRRGRLPARWAPRATRLRPVALPAQRLLRRIAAFPWPTPYANSCASESGMDLDGPVRLLTQLRSFGHCFNPVSFYYCFDRDGERVAAVSRRGDQHAVGREPRLCVAARRATASSPARFPSACTCRRSSAWTRPTCGMQRSPATSWSIHLDNVEDRRARLRRDPLAQPSSLRRRDRSARRPSFPRREPSHAGAHLWPRRRPATQRRTVPSRTQEHAPVKQHVRPRRCPQRPPPYRRRPLHHHR